MASISHDAQTCLMQLVVGLPDDVLASTLQHLSNQDWQSFRQCNKRSRRLANQFTRQLTLKGHDVGHLEASKRNLGRHFPSVDQLALSDAPGADGAVTDELIEGFVVTQATSQGPAAPGRPGKQHSLLARLRCLDLKGCAFLTARGLHHLLMATPHLQHLTTTRWAEAASLMDLPSLTQLRTLVLGDAQVDVLSVNDAALSIVAQCSSLTSLNLARCVNITDGGLDHLAALSHLSHLSIASTKVSGLNLGCLVKLTSMDASGCSQLGDQALEAMADQLCHLVRLKLEGTCCTNTGLRHLNQLPVLDTLVLGTQFELSDIGLEALARCPALRSLAFGNFNTTRPPAAGAFPALTHLQFGGTFFNRGLRFVFPLGAQLAHVVASGYDTVTDGHLACLARQISLSTLELHGGYQLSAAGLKALQALPALQRVVLVSCPLLQHTDLKQLVAVTPSLRQVLVRKSSWELPEDAITINCK